MIRWTRLAYGLLTLVIRVDVVYRLLGTGGTSSARYCYSVWLRHLVMAKDHGLSSNPASVAELGPGDSLGIGLAALLTGSDSYHALDVMQHANAAKNLAIFDELVQLFQLRAPIPDNAEFPDVNPGLTSYAFPHDILTDERMQAALAPVRLERIRQSLCKTDAPGSMICYHAPWYAAEQIKPASVDVIYSQAVLEHVGELESAYRAMYDWLKPGGYISHQIDFKCHGLSTEWNGHWTYGKRLWRMFCGNRPYLINRQPHSRHVELIERQSFRIVCDQRVRTPSKLTKTMLADEFADLSDVDLTTSGAFIQASRS